MTLLLDGNDRAQSEGHDVATFLKLNRFGLGRYLDGRPGNPMYIALDSMVGKRWDRKV